MRYLYLLAASMGVLCPVSNSFAQCLTQTPRSVQSGSTNINYDVYPSGTFLFRGDRVGYSVADYVSGSSRPTMFAMGLAMSGDVNGASYFEFEGFRTTDTRFEAGLLLPNGGAAAHCNWFSRPFTVHRSAIDALRADYADNGIINNTPAISLLEWAGRGNPYYANTLQIALPNEDLAPFVDVNNDGIYNPYSGDYPIADPARPQTIADQLSWVVFHTTNNPANGTNMNAQIEVLLYNFDCTNNGLVANATFGRTRIKNRNSLPISNLRLGIWADTDLGCSFDDFVGCDTTLNTWFAYNADVLDDFICSGRADTIGFGYNPPASAITLLDKRLYSFIYAVNNPSPLNNFSAYSLAGYWSDGTPITVGGTGYDTTNTATTRYVFPSDPNDPLGWSMAHNGAVPASDYYTMGAAESTTLAANGMMDMNFMISFHRTPANLNASMPNLANVQSMYSEIPTLKTMYQNGFLNCMAASYCAVGNDCVWAGDANRDSLVDGRDAALIATMRQQPDTTGTARSNSHTLWQPQTATPWADALPSYRNTNYKHLDCDGNGVINNDDIDVVLNTNYERTRKTYAPIYINGNDLQLARRFSPVAFVEAATIFPTTSTRYLAFRIAFHTPSTDIKTIAFKLEYDNVVWQPALLNSTIHVSPAFNGLDMYFVNPDTSVADVFFTLKQPVAPSASINTSLFRIKDAIGITATGDTVRLGAQDLAVQYADPSVAVAEVADAPRFAVYPNPTAQAFTLLLGETLVDGYSYSILNQLGQVLETRQLQAVQTQLEMRSDWTNGVYFVQINTPKGVATQKIILQR